MSVPRSVPIDLESIPKISIDPTGNPVMHPILKILTDDAARTAILVLILNQIRCYAAAGPVTERQAALTMERLITYTHLFDLPMNFEEAPASVSENSLE